MSQFVTVVTDERLLRDTNPLVKFWTTREDAEAYAVKTRQSHGFHVSVLEAPDEGRFLVIQEDGRLRSVCYKVPGNLEQTLRQFWQQESDADFYHSGPLLSRTFCTPIKPLPPAVPKIGDKITILGVEFVIFGFTESSVFVGQRRGTCIICRSFPKGALQCP